VSDVVEIKERCQRIEDSQIALIRELSKRR
jgi:hypothetical protein